MCRALAAALAAGFTYSGAATIRGYRDLFHTRSSSGAWASIDAYLAPLELTSAAALLEAVRRAGWDRTADISLVIDESELSLQDTGQLHFAASYVLYPARVWRRSTHDALHHVIVIGRSNPFPEAGGHRVSDMVRLIDLP